MLLQILPPAFKLITNSNINDGQTGTPGEDTIQKRGQKRKLTDDKKGVQENKNPIDEFKLKEGEDWKQVFCGCCIDDRPD